jgi:hypothetical protein
MCWHFYLQKENSLVLDGSVSMHPVAYTTATHQIAEAEAALNFPNKAGVITASTVDTLQVSYWDAISVSKHVDCLNG